MAQHNASGTILLVEDHAPLLRSMAFLLKVAGFEVITAGNGRDALLSLETQTPDLIITDTQMPHVDGYQLLEKVRGNGNWSRIPFILMSADYEYDDLMRGLTLGANDYLPKPFDIYDVLDSVQRVAPQLINKSHHRKAG
ncbi:MAG: response regulator [Anaerolineae bacterium]|nr:response regulator [Anaerolineae bacterium]